MPSIAEPSQNGSHFKTIQKFKADWCPSDFVLYESERTGMRVVVVDQRGPKVNGYFTLATEIHDDSGAPHTLEHLVFMGSKTFKYKGILDKLATRAYSNTNAWTAVDHTAYTLDTAGWDGFAQILPVYLEHVLLPTLTDAGCYTEVHHVDGDGHDAGVVYSEMQGTQNAQGELMDLAARRRLYPESVGFRYETGGLMEKLRVLTADRIRQFHRQMYQPKNLCLVLIGEVDHPNLLEILNKFEDSITEDVPRLTDPFDRPWIKTGQTTPIKESTIETVEFPEADESMGEALIGYLGPPYDNDLECTALDIFLSYVCGSSVSLLDNTLVEKEQLASAIYYTTDVRPDVAVWFTLSGVETSKLEAVTERLFEVLKEGVSKPLDMPYMKDCIQRFKRQLIFTAENSGKVFADSIICDHLFGKRDGSDLLKLGNLHELDVLESWDEARWRAFWKRWFVDAKHVAVLGKPSIALATSIEEKEKARVAEQQKRLGADGLKKLADKLDQAKAENDRPIPDEILRRFETPRTDSIHFIPTITARSGLAKRKYGGGNEDGGKIQRIVDADAGDLPLFIHFEHIPTNFVHLNLVMCTHALPIELRPLLTVFIDNFFTTPVMRDGTRLEFEDVVVRLEQDTIAYDIDAGRSIANAETLVIKMQIERHKYSAAIAWIRDLLWNSIFDASRLESTFAKLLADIPDAKRSGASMAAAINQLVHLSRDSTSRAYNVLVRALYLPRTFAELRADSAAVIAKLEKIRSVLASPDNFRAYVFANLDILENPVSAWSALQPPSGVQPQTDLRPLDPRRTLRDPSSAPFGRLAYLVPMPTSDSSFAYLTGAGLGSYADPSLPALSVALAYLESVEGPLWTSVRGAGLAYGVSFSRDIELGLLTFDIYRSPDAYRAFKAARTAVHDIASGTVPIDPLMLEGAVSSIVVQFANEQPTMASAATVGFVNQVVKGIGKGYGSKFMKAVRDVTADQVKEVLGKIVEKLFRSDGANLVVTCSKGLEERIKEGFEGEGWKVLSKPLAEFQDGYGTSGDADIDIEMGEDGEDEDGDEEEEEEGEEE